MKFTVRAGTVIQGPGKQAYRIKRDIEQYAPVKSSDFEALGGAPEPKPGTRMPEWLADYVKGKTR